MENLDKGDAFLVVNFLVNMPFICGRLRALWSSTSIHRTFTWDPEVFLFMVVYGGGGKVPLILVSRTGASVPPHPYLVHFPGDLRPHCTWKWRGGPEIPHVYRMIHSPGALRYPYT